MATQRDIALDGNGDWKVSGADLALVSDSDAVLQSLKIRLQFFRGEWFLDEEAGVPYFDEVLVKNPDPNLLSSIFRTAILETPGVNELNALSVLLDRSTRRLTVSFRVGTDLGELDATVEV